MTPDQFLAARWAEEEASGPFTFVFLADLAVKRRILAAHPQTRDGRCGVCARVESWSYTSRSTAPVTGGHLALVHVPWPCQTVRLLLSRYVTHRDHDEAWQPDPG